MRLATIFQRFRLPITLTLSIVLIEKVAWIIEPTVFGHVIDAMIAAASHMHHSKIFGPLFLWMSIFAINSAAGALSRSLGKRIYSNMFTEIVTDVVVHDTRHGYPESRTAARADLSKEYITFLQYRVPEIIEQIVDIGGAVIALFVFDHRISLACLAMIVPLTIATRIYSKSVLSLENELHDNREEVYEKFTGHDMKQVRGYYNKIAKIQQRIANWSAFNFAFFRMFLLGIFLVVIYISIDLDDFTTGRIYSIVAYLWTFVTTAEYMPDLMEDWASLKDISTRFREKI